MVSIYSHKTSPRLQYISHFLFKELSGMDVTVIDDIDRFKQQEGIKINYSDGAFDDGSFHICPAGLLSEENIQQQTITYFTIDNNKAFFQTMGKDLPFDIFSAAFYLISRYEEYLPHTKDEYGRYPHTGSIAFKEDFLHLPLINIWTQSLIYKLKARFPTFNFQLSTFSFQPTYDIDMAFSYRHKGVLRNAGGFLRSPSMERVAVLLGIKKDPFDSYEWMDKLHEENNLSPIYFFLVAARNGRYDKNILLHKNIMHKLTRYYADKYSIGLHPSWQSGDDHSLLQKEKGYLQAMSGITVIRSRQHYIRFTLPDTYRSLIVAGITADHSMGYGTINGFRASVANSFYWYDLYQEKQTGLRVHPFCFMDANSFYEQQLSPKQAYDELLHYYNACKAIGGTFTTIWHNNFLGTARQFTDWRELYEQFILQLRQ